MTKIWKQSLSLLLAAILVLALIPAQPLTANAANGYQWSYATGYDWLTGTFETADTDGIYEVGQAYDWYATLAPTKGAYTISVSGTVVDDATGATISSCSKSVDVAKGPAKTPIISYADFPELTEDLAGTFTMTCVVSLGGKNYAQLQARFTREAPAAPAITYGAEWQYLATYEWIQGSVATADADHVFEEGQAYDWAVTISPTATSASVIVNATIVNKAGEVISAVTDKAVDCGKAPAVTTLLTAADFPELTGELLGDYMLEASVSIGTKVYAGVDYIFGRTGAYVAPEEPSEPETPTEPSEPETPTEPSEPETPVAPTKPGEAPLWQYATSGEGETYAWMNGDIATKNTTGIYKGWDAYDWAVTLCPTKASATITVEANVIDHTGAEVGTCTKEVEVGKAPSVTTILTAADLGLNNKTLGDFRVTAVIKYTNAETQETTSMAQVQFVFGRRIGDPGYSAVEYLKGYDWINGAFNAADEDKSYIGEQPYDWTVSIAPSKSAATVDVAATVIDEHGNVVASLNKTGVECAKTAATTILSASELEELTNDLYGKFALTCIVSMAGKQYVGVYSVFERVEGEWVAPSDPTDPVFTPAAWEACGLPQDIEVHNPGEMAKRISVNITITKPDGTTISMAKTVDVAVGGSATLATTNQLRNVVTERGAEYTVTIEGYWKNAYQQVDINETLTYVQTEHTDTEVIPGCAATCTETGLTDGVFCHGCEGTIVEQEEIEIDPEAHNFVDGSCACGATEAPERLDIRGVSRSKNLALEGTILVYANVAFMDSTATTNAEGLTKEYVMENGRLLFWSLADMPENAEDAVLGTETHCAEFDKTSDYKGIHEYYAYSHGIPAKEYNDTIYYRTYIVVDGVEYYGDIIEYSVVTYCENQLKKTTANANKMKPLLAAMLNYGAAAQEYFGYKTDAKANACLQTYVDQGLLDAAHLTLNWSDSYLTALDEADAAMTVNFAENEAKRTSKNLGLEGAVETKLTFAYKLNGNVGSMMPADGNVTFYYWTAGTYNALKAAGKVLTKDNADYIKTGDEITQTYTTKYGYEYYAMSNGIPAKQLGETIYTAAVFTMADGTEYCSGVTVYSAEEYASGQISKASAAANLKTLAKWMVCYGEAAYTYFNS